MIDLNDVLLAMSNIPVDDPIAEIWGRGLQGGYKIIEYTGSLPITINANGDALLDYRIYGADGGVGVATESGEPAGYKLPMVTVKNLFNSDGTYEVNKYKDNNGTIQSYNNAGYYTQYMPISSEDLISVKNARGNTDLAIRLYYYDSQKNWIRRSGGDGYVTDFTETPPAGAAFIQLQLGTPYAVNADKIIISQGGTTTPVYIGENQLMEDEYVSYGEQKIYKRTENLIPSSEAQTQTSNGVTATCDGNGVYTFTGTAGENGARFEFPIEEFTTPDLSVTDYIISLFNTKGLSVNDIIGIGSTFYIYPANRVIKNPSTGSNKKVSKINLYFQPNRETNFTMSPMLVLGTVAPSQFVPYIVLTDPPVPLPEIPTINGETVIDYDGTPKPSQMYVKYKVEG